MSIVDIIILGLIAAAFVAVCLYVRRHGSCGDCGSSGSCSGSCGSCSTGSCAACQGVDAVAKKLARGVK